MRIAVVIVIPLLLLLLPSFIFGDQINVGMKKDGNSSEQRHVHPAQEELLRGCEEVTGLDLAICIVNRFAEDLQMKQNQHLDRLKKTGGSKSKKQRKAKRKQAHIDPFISSLQPSEENDDFRTISGKPRVHP